MSNLDRYNVNMTFFGSSVKLVKSFKANFNKMHGKEFTWEQIIEKIAEDYQI